MLVVSGSGFMSIGDSERETVPEVVYKRSSQSWVVLLPSWQDADVVVPTLCGVGGVCKAVEEARVECGKVSTVVLANGWQHGRLSGENDACEALFSRVAEEKAAVQNELRDACGDALGPCMRVLLPAGVELFDGAAGLAGYANENGYKLQLRLVRIRVMLDVFSVHGVTLTLNLQRPTLTEGNAVLLLQHECARRGLYAPALSSMELFVTPSAREVCVWTCRPDYVRTPWNTHPPEVGGISNTSGVQNASSAQACRAVPLKFTAVEFEVHALTSLRNPVPALLWHGFFAELDLASRALEEALEHNGARGAQVSMKIMGSDFDDREFAQVVRELVAFTRAAGRYERIVNELYAPAGARRLLQTVQSVVNVQGLLFTEAVDLAPATLAQALQRAVQATDAHVAWASGHELLTGLRSVQVNFVLLFFLCCWVWCSIAVLCSFLMRFGCSCRGSDFRIPSSFFSSNMFTTCSLCMRLFVQSVIQITSHLFWVTLTLHFLHDNFGNYL